MPSKVEHYAAMLPKYIFHLWRSGQENGAMHVCVCAQMQGTLASPGVVSDQ